MLPRTAPLQCLISILLALHGEGCSGRSVATLADARGAQDTSVNPPRVDIVLPDLRVQDGVDGPKLPTDTWAVASGGYKLDVGQDIAVDAAGNVIVVGSFEDQVSFGTAQYTSKGSMDGFVAKLDPQGSFLWSRTVSGPNLNFVAAVALDAAGSVFVLGSYSGTAAFDPGVELTASGSGYDCFLAKYSAAGALVWVGDIKVSGTCDARDLDIDAAGNTYATGISEAVFKKSGSR